MTAIPQFLPDTQGTIRFDADYGNGLGDLAYRVRGDVSETTMYYSRRPAEGITAGMWWGDTNRKDADGRVWTCWHHAVTDDFGNLVEARS